MTEDKSEGRFLKLDGFEHCVVYTVEGEPKDAKPAKPTGLRWKLAGTSSTWDHTFRVKLDGVPRRGEGER